MGSRFGRGASSTVTLSLCVLHGLAIWTALGGRSGLSSGWPIYRDDHPLYYHSALVTRHFLAASGTTAGYDPSFMSGYAKSVVFPASSTLPELVIALFGGSRPELAYKLYVLVSAALIPWLVALAANLWHARGWTTTTAVALFLFYVWTDFPINYAAFGMLPYLLVIPLGLVATGAFCRFLERGGLAWWSVVAVAMSAVVLVHLTAAMIVVPAAGLAYAMAVWASLSRREGGGAGDVSPAETYPLTPPPGTHSRAERGRDGFPVWRHLGVWAVVPIVLGANAFWWYPGLWLASTKGPSDFVFRHPEPVSLRLWQILNVEAPIECVLWGMGIVGLAGLAKRDRVYAAGLGGFVGAGFFWGYLAGGFRALDFLQPGRQTYAFYTGLCVASALGAAEVCNRLKEGMGGRLDRWAIAGAILIGLRLFGPSLEASLSSRLGGVSLSRPFGSRADRREPFLSSRPTPRLLWVVDRVKRHVKPGERLLYEEAGFDLPGVADPFEGGRFSGLLPEKTGVEVLGGPYLHASLTTNFTQFGEGKLFGSADWGREHFIRYARLYRPTAIVCWSPHARAFCSANPGLVRILDDDGVVLIGRVLGFEGDTIEGTAEVEALPGRLRIRGAVAGVDGNVVLRYHSVPCLRADRPVLREPLYLEEDPVPFIRLRIPPDTSTLELTIPPISGMGRSR